MKKSDFTYKAPDGKVIHASKWEPEQGTTPKGLFQIVHGMAEHRNRYEEFTEFLTGNGFICFAEDHRGHGETMTDLSERGFFAEENGWFTVLEDIKLLSDRITEEHPGLPLFLFGFSMGSLLSRTYIIKHPENLAGVILGGTAPGQGILGKIGLAICRFEIKRKGIKTPSPMLDSLSFGAYNRAFRPNRTDFDWLSRDEAAVDDYVADPLAGFVCSCGFFLDLLTGVEFISVQKNVNMIPDKLPLLFLSGESDPVGKMGKGVTEVFNMFKKAGLKDVNMKLYPEARHAIIAETNKAEVYQDILGWLEAHTA